MNIIKPKVAPTDSRKAVVGIVRVSTEEQAAQDRAGLPRQRDAIARVANANGLEIIEVVELAGVSGTITGKHPEILRVLQMVKQKAIAGIVLADLDRLFRPKRAGDFGIFNAFEDAGASIWTDSGSFDFSDDNGILMSLIRGAIAGSELRGMMRRVVQAREKKRLNGELGGPKILLPTGVDYDFDSRKWSYTEKVVTVQEAFRIVDEERLANMSAIGKRLGINPATLRLWLRNPIYKGIRLINQKRGNEIAVARKFHPPGKRRDRRKIRRSEGEIIERQVISAPAVSPERWDRVQTILNDTGLRWRKDRAAAGTQINLGSGILKCGYCGGRLYASSGRNKKHPNRPGYYYCRRNHYLSKRTGGCCVQKNIQKGHLDTLLREFVCEYLTTDQVLETLATSIEQRVEQPVDVAPSLKSLEAREARLYEGFERGVIPPEKLRERLALIKEDRDRLLDLGREHARLRQRAQQSAGLLQAVIAGAFAFRRLSTTEEQKLALSQMFSEITVTDCSVTGIRPQSGFPSTVSQIDTRTGRD